MTVNPSDEDLMARCAKGDAAAYEILVKRHLDRSYAIAARMGGSRTDAQDAAQEAFLKLWVNAPSWQPGKAKFSTWFYRIVVNAAIDRGRRQGNRQVGVEPETLASFADEDRKSVEQQYADTEQWQQVRHAASRLPERQRTALALCYEQGLGEREAAEVMGIGVKALESLLARAKQALRQKLNGDRP